jgi:putative nucleotidyltransferase with HDIG domain
MTLKELQKIVDGIKDLPTLPTIIMKVIEVINNPKSSVRDIKSIIENDYVQTVRVLRLANSSYYGFPQKISTITTAIVLLGFNEIKNLLLSSSVYDLFASHSGTKKFYFDHLKFLDHSIGVAIASRAIAEFVRYEEPEELFVGGLLHDIGRVVQKQFLAEDFEKLMVNVITTDSLIYKKEKRVIGYTHTEVGMLLAKKWKMTEKIINIIAYHHRPLLSTAFAKEAAIVNLADIIIRSLSIGSGGDNQIPIIDEEVFKITNFPIDKIESLMLLVEDRFKETKALFQVKANGS